MASLPHRGSPLRPAAERSPCRAPASTCSPRHSCTPKTRPRAGWFRKAPKSWSLTEIDFVHKMLVNTGNQVYSGTIAGSAPVMLHDDRFRFQVNLATGEEHGRV